MTRVAGGTNGKLLLARCVPLRSSEKIDRPIGLGSLARLARAVVRARPPDNKLAWSVGVRDRGPPSVSIRCFSALRIHGYTRRERRKRRRTEQIPCPPCEGILIDFFSR